MISYDNVRKFIPLPALEDHEFLKVDVENKTYLLKYANQYHSDPKKSKTKFFTLQVFFR
jgi:hypothetical protein